MNKYIIAYAMFTVPVIASNLATETYVKWGDTTLEGTNAIGLASAHISGGYATNTGFSFYNFTGTATATTGYRSASVDLSTLVAINPLYAHQIAGGGVTTPDTLVVAGGSSSAIIRYTMEFSILYVGEPPSLTWSYSLKQNTTNLGLLTLEEIGDPYSGFYRLILEATNSVILGQPFNVEMALKAEMDIQSGDDYRVRIVSLNIIDIEVESETGDPLTDQVTIIGQYGHLATPMTPLYINRSNDNIIVEWHSLTGHLYQAQVAGDISDSGWSNVGSSQIGTGTNNWVAITNSSSANMIRVREEY